MVNMPIYPYLSVIAAYPLFLLIQNINIKTNYNLTIILLITIVFAYPYYLMFNKAQSNIIRKGESLCEANENYLFTKIRENANLDGIKVYYYNNKSSLLFYKYRLADKSQRILLTNYPSFNIYDKILVSNDSLKRVLKANIHLI